MMIINTSYEETGTCCILIFHWLFNMTSSWPFLTAFGGPRPLGFSSQEPVALETIRRHCIWKTKNWRIYQNYKPSISDNFTRSISKLNHPFLAYCFELHITTWSGICLWRNDAQIEMSGQLKRGNSGASRGTRFFGLWPVNHLKPPCTDANLGVVGPMVFIDHCQELDP